MISGTYDYTVDVSKLQAVFEDYSSRYCAESIGQLCLLCWETLECANLSGDTLSPRREKAWREVEGPLPGNLGYGVSFGGDLTSNVCR